MFDRYAAATAPSWGRRALVMASVVLHVSAAIGLIIYSICRIEEIPPPALSITFLQAPTPPPPPAAGSPKPKTEQTAPKKPSVPRVITAPNSVVEPQVKSEPATSDDSPGEPSAPSGPVGAPDGKPGGVIDGHGTAPAKVATAPMFVLMASAISAPDPHLTDEFKNSHAGQSVNGAYRVCLGTDGRVTDVSVISPIPTMDGLIESHIKSAWQFKPQALPVCFTKPFKFNIK